MQRSVLALLKHSAHFYLSAALAFHMTNHEEKETGRTLITTQSEVYCSAPFLVRGHVEQDVLLHCGIEEPWPLGSIGH